MPPTRQSASHDRGCLQELRSLRARKTSRDRPVAETSCPGPLEIHHALSHRLAARDSGLTPKSTLPRASQAGSEVLVSDCEPRTIRVRSQGMRLLEESDRDGSPSTGTRPASALARPTEGVHMWQRWRKWDDTTESPCVSSASPSLMDRRGAKSIRRFTIWQSLYRDHRGIPRRTGTCAHKGRSSRPGLECRTDQSVHRKPDRGIYRPSGCRQHDDRAIRHRRRS